MRRRSGRSSATTLRLKGIHKQDTYAFIYDFSGILEELFGGVLSAWRFWRLTRWEAFQRDLRA